MAILELSNFTPDGQRNVPNEVRFWRGTVQAESTTDVAPAEADISGLAGYGRIMFSITGPNGLTSDDFPVIQLIASDLGHGMQIEAAELLASTARLTSGLGSNPPVGVQDNERLDSARVNWGAGLYLLRCTYEGMQTNLDQLQINMFAWIGRGP